MTRGALTGRPDVTIAIVTWNSGEHIRRCLDSLRDPLVTTELVLVDNASTDDTVEKAVRTVPRARIIRNAENRGFAAAQAQAWEAVTGRYWLLLNPDAALQSGALAALTRFMDGHPSVALASPRLVDVAGTLQHCAQRVPAVSLCLLEASRLHLLLPRPVRGRVLLGSYYDHCESCPVGWTWGTALVARREAVEHVGPPWREFFMYGEDLEWSLRMRSAGWQVWYCADAVVLHHGAGSSSLRWSDVQRQERIQAGIYGALGMHRSRAYMVTLHLATLLALLLEGAARWCRRRPIPQDVRVALRYHLSAIGLRGRQHHHTDA